MALAFTGRFASEDLIFGTDLRDLEIAVQDGQATLYGVTGMNGGLSRWQLDSTGGLAQLQSQQLHGQASIRTGNFQLAEVGGWLRLVQEQSGQGALTSYQLRGDGSLSGQSHQALAGAGPEGLGAVAVLQLDGGKSGFYGAGQEDGRLQGWRLDATGRVETQTGRAGDDRAYVLEDAVALAAVQGAGGAVLLAADAQGLRSYQADAASGALALAGVCGLEQGLTAGGFTALETAEAGGRNWALLGAAGSSSISVMEVLGTGALRFAGQVNDTQATRFGGLTALEVVELDGHVLVLAAGHDGGLSLFRLAPDGQLIHLQALVQQDGYGLQNVTALEAAAVGGYLQVFATSGTVGGISQFVLPLADLGVVRTAAAADAQLTGSAADDLLQGGAGAVDLYGRGGDDVLVSGQGGGRLSGGSGADIFVIDPASEQVTVRDFTPGQDQLDLSGFDGLYSPTQLTVQETGTGLVLQVAETALTVNSGGGGTLTLADLFGPALQFSAPDRLDLGVTLPGGGFWGDRGDDQLTGTGGDDELRGLDGQDQLAGQAGRDTLYGGAGADQLLGGSGNDQLKGNSGNDSLSGDGGQDLLLGGQGADRLAGGLGGDRLKGGADRDLLTGQGGNDRLKGGAGADRLNGGSGADTLAGGKGADHLHGQAGTDRLNGGRDHDHLSGGSGADVFVFALSHGRDTIADFDPGSDRISLLRASADGFQDLDISRLEDGTLIGTGSGWIVLEDVLPRHLGADDFLF
ncbi:hypothetical protein AB838_16590 [Rhodobacteraceae bacterium (ex Bugula neritina AB1)]|nr:hypothetical protein AB838_16590 [Rhodobacteraceae bacterium (ex Bugula neritina AB1)]